MMSLWVLGLRVMRFLFCELEEDEAWWLSWATVWLSIEWDRLVIQNYISRISSANWARSPRRGAPWVFWPRERTPCHYPDLSVVYILQRYQKVGFLPRLGVLALPPDSLHCGKKKTCQTMIQTECTYRVHIQFQYWVNTYQRQRGRGSFVLIDFNPILGFNVHSVGT